MTPRRAQQFVERTELLLAMLDPEQYGYLVDAQLREVIRQTLGLDAQPTALVLETEDAE